MDSAIMYYFDNVIKPTVFENGEQIKVPTMYASPERWHSINKTGFMRDSKRQIILPVIAFRRTGMEKDDTIAVDKIDPLDPKLFYTFERKFTDNNRYDNFKINFYNKVQKGFLKLSKNKKKYVLLDSNNSTPAENLNRIIKEFKKIAK